MDDVTLQRLREFQQYRSAPQMPAPQMPAPQMPAPPSALDVTTQAGTELAGTTLDYGSEAMADTPAANARAQGLRAAIDLLRESLKTGAIGPKPPVPAAAPPAAVQTGRAAAPKVVAPAPSAQAIKAPPIKMPTTQEPPKPPQAGTWDSTSRFQMKRGAASLYGLRSKTASTSSELDDDTRNDLNADVEERALTQRGGPNAPAAEIWHGTTGDVPDLDPRPHYLADDEPVVFGAPSKVVASLFMAPWSDEQFDLSRDEGGTRLTELQPGALEEVFQGKSGTLFQLDPSTFGGHPNLWSEERVSYEKPEILGRIEIPDILAHIQASPGVTIQRFSEPKLAAGVKSRDIELWEAWVKNPGPMTLQPLMTAVDPVIQSEVNRWSSQVPRIALEREGKKLALQAFKTYKPEKGAALNTHVMNYLRKLSRVVYSHQDTIRLPENKKLMSQSLYRGQKHLLNANGVEPSSQELANHLGWSMRKVESVQRSTIGEFVGSQDVGGDMFIDSGDVSATDSKVYLVYHDLSEQEKLVFEHTTGYSGKQILTADKIARKLNLTVHQVNYAKKKISDKLEKMQ